MRKLVGIYTQDDSGTLAHIVETIAEASRWIGVTVDALYKSQHLHGTMQARGYKLELIDREEPDLVPYGVFFVRYRDLDNPGIIKERGSCYAVAPYRELDDWTIDDINEGIIQGHYELIEALTSQNYSKKYEEDYYGTF